MGEKDISPEKRIEEIHQEREKLLQTRKRLEEAKQIQLQEEAEKTAVPEIPSIPTDIPLEGEGYEINESGEIIRPGRSR